MRDAPDVTRPAFRRLQPLVDRRAIIGRRAGESYFWLVMRLTRRDPCLTELDAWPADVDLICSAMDACRSRDDAQRRGTLRRPHRVIARLQVHGEPSPTRIYTRDCDPTHLGFLAESPVSLGLGSTVEFGGPDGSIYSAACAVQRCRECVPGWFEGVVRFNRPIPTLRLGCDD